MVDFDGISASDLDEASDKVETALAAGVWDDETRTYAAILARGMPKVLHALEFCNERLKMAREQIKLLRARKP